MSHPLQPPVRPGGQAHPDGVARAEATGPEVLARLRTAYRSCLLQLAARDLSGVLALEDVHQLDDASCDLLDRLARTAPERTWLLVVTRRDTDGQVPHDMGGGDGQAHERPAIDLDGNLSAHDVHATIADDGPEQGQARDIAPCKPAIG